MNESLNAGLEEVITPWGRRARTVLTGLCVTLRCNPDPQAVPVAPSMLAKSRE